jgi:hypothetical protein
VISNCAGGTAELNRNDGFDKGVLPTGRWWHRVDMNTLTIKIPPGLKQELLQLSVQTHLSKSELVQRALTAFMTQRSQPNPLCQS